MSDDFSKAEDMINKSAEQFANAADRLKGKEKEFTESSKKMAGKVKDSAQKLSDGLLKMEKAANFDKLERYVELMERAATAMSVLADLEQSGKLEKIAAAVKQIRITNKSNGLMRKVKTWFAVVDASRSKLIHISNGIGEATSASNAESGSTLHVCMEKSARMAIRTTCNDLFVRATTDCLKNHGLAYD